MAPKNTSFDVKKMKMKMKTKTKNMKKTKKKLKLSKSERKKTLYLCFVERHSEDRVSYVVRSIELGHLFSSGDDDSVRQLKKVGYKAWDEHLPSSIGCGLFGSQILFAAGFTPATKNPHPKFSTYQKDVYAFETDSRKLQVDDDDDGVSNILKMDGKLVNNKLFPLMVVLGGKLCAISRRYVHGIAFEVFDPESKTWHDLPNPPFWDDSGNSWCINYAITGTKMFISYGSSPVFCFDISHENRHWRRVDSMGGPFDFDNNALVLDLPGHPNKKLIFGCGCRRCVNQWKLRVYIMSLDEGRESIIQVANMELPAVLPRGFAFAGAYYTLHVGGQKGCLVAPRLRLPYGEGPRYGEVGSHKITGLAIPFEFEVDFNKIDDDPINCLTLEFMPSRVFEFYTSPSTFPDCGHEACFIV